ncbi:hypothetical protein QQY66_42080 [Streptomyces sp. DG2A-72]|nr:hypothetical protein [Streptomyces sp. DG2A-72]MDO0938000.1 hypothetical protein [Streptomyces sp. DG2A-72]
MIGKESTAGRATKFAFQMNSDSNKTVPTALNGFISSFNIDWG